MISSIFLLASCSSGESSYKFKPEVFTEKDFALLDTRINKVIKLYMNRDEIEKVYKSEGEKYTPFPFNATTYNGLIVSYSDDIATCLAIEEGENAKYFKTLRNTSIGSDQNTVTESYGEFKPQENTIDYIVQKNDKEFIYQKNYDYSSMKDNLLIVEFKFNNNKTVKTIGLCDYDFAMHGE
jgi:hypothetical protein